MDSSFGFSPTYNQRQARSFDTTSHLTTSLGVALKAVDLPCQFHAQQQSTKCHQPLCSECIEDHLLYHKKQGYSDLGIKSLRGLRKECIVRLTALIQELVRRLGQLEAPVPPEQQLEVLEGKLQSVRIKMHQIIQGEFNRLKDSLRVALNESANYFKSMAETHSRLEALIEQLRDNHSTLADGGNRAFTIPECIKKTLTLDVEALLDTFQKESIAYETRRNKSQLEVLFQPELIRNCIVEAVKIVTPQSLNTSAVSNTSRLFQAQKFNFNKYEDDEEEESSDVISLPPESTPRGNGKLLHFFETGSNKLHFISVVKKKQGLASVAAINEFVVPSFHASLVSANGQFIFLSGGVVEFNGGVSKSPLFIRFSVRTQTCKKDFAKVKPRSSHSLCQDNNGDIYILGGYGASQGSEGEPSFELAVQKVNPRSGRVQLEMPSHWGGSNISFLIRDHILKACEEGIELYSLKMRQWIIADIKTKPRSDYSFNKNAGFACLNDSDVFVFGGYTGQTDSSDSCFHWHLTFGQKPKATITPSEYRLPVAEGFENCCALVDDQGFFVLQNVEDQQNQFCVDDVRRLLRFNLQDRSWKILEILDQ